MAAILLLGTTLSAQNGYKVKGVVIDEMGPVIGATVMEQGTTVGTTTGLDGDYELTVSSADATVAISCIGYTTQTFQASAVPATVTLLTDAEFLDDVVVIGYGTVKKEDMTGSVVAVKADNINRGAITSPAQALVGKVSGLNIIPASGEPGAKSAIRIRGGSSLTASNDPLIVIDGVPITKEGGAFMGDPLASVNPDDIESFSVLKDASATAIYGSRASNGVIIITTKKGTKGDGVRVSYNGSFSAKQNYRTFDVMNAAEFTDYINQTYPEKAGLLGSADTDWQKEIYRVGLSTDHNVSVMAGKKIPARLSLGYNYDQGTLKVGDATRYNADLNLVPKFFDDHLSVNANVKGIYSDFTWGDTGAVGNAITFNPTMPVRKEDGSFFNWYNADGSANTLSSYNPVAMLYDAHSTGNALRSIGNLQLDYRIHGFEDLRFNLNLGYDVADSRSQYYRDLGTYVSDRYIATSGDFSNQARHISRNTLLEFYADYNHEFKHSNLDVMAGYSWQHNYYRWKGETYNNQGNHFAEDNLYIDSPESAREYYLISFFGRINYSIASKYLFTFTLRDDATSRFAKNVRWGLFPSAAFAWNIKNEDWLKGSPAVSALKLRLGWGKTGQQDIGDDYYQYIAKYYLATDPRMQYNMGGTNVNALAPQGYNPRVKWETTTTWNAGLDFGFVNDRITGSAEAYYRVTDDLLNSVSIPLGGNFTNYLIQNIGQMVNKGIELTLNTVPVETGDWHWSIGGNVTFQDTRITKLTAKDENYKGVETGGMLGGTDGFSALHRVGQSPNVFYLYEQLYDADGEPVQNGLVDRNGDGIISAEDRYVTGYSPNAWMFYGLNTRVNYKNWDFSMNTHGSVGNMAINAVRKGYSSSFSDDASKGYLNNFVPAFLYPTWTKLSTDYQSYSNLWIEDASFFKLDDINLGYTWHLKKFAQSIRLAGSVQNVFILTKYTGLDPELYSTANIRDGVDGNLVPRPRLYTVRLNINF
ncbi:MAG: SusC/RagA family TonB-linked outer membrane protein [Bacteroidales bacterium]|nr:SusC/RagA family TonB-linked outer membrane protein [Bacteroidales bacterium]